MTRLVTPMDDNISMRDNKQRKDFMKVLLLTLAFALGCLVFGGCKSPPVNYTIQSSCPDIWDAEPKQTVSVKMEFRR